MPKARSTTFMKLWTQTYKIVLCCCLAICCHPENYYANTKGISPATFASFIVHYGFNLIPFVIKSTIWLHRVYQKTILCIVSLNNIWIFCFKDDFFYDLSFHLGVNRVLPLRSLFTKTHVILIIIQQIDLLTSECFYFPTLYINCNQLQWRITTL